MIRDLNKIIFYYNLIEESWPIGLNINTSSLQDGGNLLWWDGDIVTGKDEIGVTQASSELAIFSFSTKVSLQNL